MSLNDAVVKKLKDEFGKYLDYLSELSPGEVIEEAYEIVVKAGFIDRFEQGYVSNSEQLLTLMNQDEPLETLYHDWLKTSLHFEEILEGSIDYSMERLPQLQLPGQPTHGHSNEGYDISQAVLFDNNTGFVVGESDTAAHPFVTWRMFNDQGTLAYETGRYFDDEASARYDYKNRVDDYSQDKQLIVVDLPVAKQPLEKPSENKKQPSMAEVLREAQAKADRINAQNALNKSATPKPDKDNPQIGD